jgi:hypothetical protein
MSLQHRVFVDHIFNSRVVSKSANVVLSVDCEVFRSDNLDTGTRSCSGFLDLFTAFANQAANLKPQAVVCWRHRVRVSEYTYVWKVHAVYACSVGIFVLFRRVCTCSSVLDQNRVLD